MASVEVPSLSQLFERIYDRLHELSSMHMRGQPAGHTLQPTAVVHEAFLKLAHRESSEFASEEHFAATAALILRNVLVDHARRRSSAKRGRGRRGMDLETFEPSKPDDVAGVLELEDALAAPAHGAADDVNEVRLDNQGIVTCRGFVVLDKHNRVRIQGGIDDNGDATICWIDPAGKRRVVAGTALNGDASVLWLDPEGKRRMGAAAAANGNAGMYFADRNDVMRVGIATKNSGTGGVHVYDKDGKLRISAATFKDEQLSLPNEDLGAI